MLADIRTRVLQEGLNQRKVPMAPSGMGTTTFSFVAQCFKPAAPPRAPFKATNVRIIQVTAQ